MTIVKKKTQRGDVTCLKSHSQDYVLEFLVKCFSSLSCCLSVLNVVDRDSATICSQVLCQSPFPHHIFPGSWSACPGPCPLAPFRQDCSLLWSRVILPCAPIIRVLLLISKGFFQMLIFLVFVKAPLHGFLYPAYTVDPQYLQGIGSRTTPHPRQNTKICGCSSPS